MGEREEKSGGRGKKRVESSSWRRNEYSIKSPEINDFANTTCEKLCKTRLNERFHANRGSRSCLNVDTPRFDSFLNSFLICLDTQIYISKKEM